MFYQLVSIKAALLEVIGIVLCRVLFNTHREPCCLELVWVDDLDCIWIVSSSQTGTRCWGSNTAFSSQQFMTGHAVFRRT